jgi:excisionase family DNA binding protein
MTGTNLHRFDLELCFHVLDNISTYRDGPAFAAFIEEWMEPAVLTYLKALDGDTEPAPLLLSNEELEDLAGVFGGEEFQFDRDWIPYEGLYRRSIDCVAEIRDALAKPYADEWASLSAQFAERLEARGVWLHHGIEIVREWVSELRRLLRAMGATHFLPAPEGAFPTPTCPQPPPPSPTPPSPAQANPRADEGLMAAIGEIRDLLVSQRTVKDWYSTEEVAQLLSKSEFTVREWCRNGRIRAEKKGSGRGKYQSWVVSHAELLRIRREGLLPLKR